jgi:sulfoxide reductase catalytic subunit YedY
MASRWPGCTAAWTCAATTDVLIKRAPEFRASDVTPHALYLRRREFLQAAAAAAAGAAIGLAPSDASAQLAGPGANPKLPNVKKSPLSLTDPPTSYKDITTYNNFYETGLFQAGTVDARRLRTSPWTISIEGMVAKPLQISAEELIATSPLEERIYRHRCVETWSAIIPWVGIPFAEVIKRVQPTSEARFVEFTTLLDQTQLPGQRNDILKWPYTEGLRLDEAMHPLTILAVGLYGEMLPKQNGAPIHLVVPWKYGFKGAKSLTRIRFVPRQPTSTWMLKEPRAYGFYANVNPEVDHPRWTQARERRLGEFLPRRTLMLNGYADQVASLYTGMDLRRNY